MSERVLLYGSFYINENIVVTIHNKNSKEKIIGYGNQDIMNTVFQCKLNFIKFKESTFMKDKIIQNSYSFSVNDNTFFIYNILEIEKKKKRMNKSEINKSQSKIKEKNKSVEEDKISINTSFIEESEEDTENVNEENTINNTKKANYFFEENMSQASSVTSNSGNSFWNLNKANLKDDQNNFTSKSFLNLQILLSGLLIIILTMIIISIFSLKILQSTLSDYFESYFDLRQFVRTFQQFSYSFMALICVVKPDGTCEEYISSLDTKEFNQSLFLLE